MVHGTWLTLFSAPRVLLPPALKSFTVAFYRIKQAYRVAGIKTPLNLVELLVSFGEDSAPTQRSSACSCLMGLESQLVAYYRELNLAREQILAHEGQLI